MRKNSLIAGDRHVKILLGREENNCTRGQIAISGIQRF